MSEGAAPGGDSIRGISRRHLLALGGGAAAAAALGISACGSGSDSETSKFGEGDVGILNYALTLEYVEAALYENAVESGLFGQPHLAILRKFHEEENDHTAALSKLVERLGGEPVAKPKTTFPMKEAEAVLVLVGKLENLGAAAYLEQLPKLHDGKALATVLSIHSVEGKHAAAVASLSGNPITPDGPFAKPASASVVLRSFEPFITG
jgi:hypothetical protein